jgi:hypothetical protein
MKNTISSIIKGDIPENDAKNNHFTIKKYLVCLEEQF